MMSYSLSRGIHSVPELWKEWFVGLNGGPSVASMDRLYKWRDSEKERRF